MTNKVYLGDAVYAALDRWGRVVLTTEDGIQATNTIVLEPEVLAALDRYVHDLARPSGGVTRRLRDFVEGPSAVVLEPDRDPKDADWPKRTPDRMADLEDGKEGG